MATTVVAADVAPRRRIVQSAGNGEKHWRTDYLGERARASSAPEAFLIEMSAGETLLPHFHAVDQFQVFVDGNGTLGRASTGPVTVHYADRYTAYGPIVASDVGLSYFTFRPAGDPGAVYRNFPDYRERLKPSRRRHSTTAGVHLCTEPVLASRTGAQVDALFDDERYDDGVGAAIIRMAPHARVAGDDPGRTGGQYYLVLNGAIEMDGRSCGRWSIVHVARGDAAPELHALEGGAEVLQLAFGTSPP